ncbi:MAG TPA: cytochrome c biogenesis protein ResB [Blastocatellia bacterium]|nr:cytochrome c biogenesis protein ResB [Blastocatellia bacterium]
MATTKTDVTGGAQAAVTAPVEAVPRVKKNESILDKVLRLLSSVRFGVTMLVIVLICCVIGMLVMQKDVQGFEEYFARRTPAERTIFGALGFYDIYHAWYFTGLLAVTGLNIILASIDRFPSAWKFLARPNFKQTPKALSHMMLNDQAEVREDPKSLAERIEESWRKNPFTRSAITWQRVLMLSQALLLMGLLLYILPPGILRWATGLVTFLFLAAYLIWGLGYKYTVTKEEGRTTIFAENNSWNRLGAYMVHVALLTLFVGGVLTSRFSMGGIMEIRPGVSTRSFTTFDMVKKNGRWEREIGEAKVPFDVVCTDLQQKLIRPEAGLDTMNTMDWLSYVTIKDPAAGKEVPATIHMNYPFDYRGYRLFQSQFNPVGNARNVTIIFKPVTAADPIEVEIPRNGSVDIEGIGNVKYVQFLPDYIKTAEGPTTASPDYNNPVAVLAIDGKQAVMAFNLQLAERVLTAKGKSEDGASPEDYTFKVNGTSYVALLKEFEKASLTHSLEVRRDPGQNPFYIGSMLLLLSLGCVFFFSHERVWAVVEPDGKGSKVYFGGNTNRNKPSFEGRYRALVESVIGGGKKDE